MLVEGGSFFRGRESVLVGLPVKMGEFVRKLKVTKMLLHVTLGRWWRGRFIRWVSPGRVCSFLTSEFNDMLIH